MVKLINPINDNPLERTEKGLVDKMGAVFPLVRGAYRFVEASNYTDNFGYQWNKFQKTQIDRALTQHQQSTERFFAQTGWKNKNLQNKNVLEVGSGAGRFSQVILSNTKANLYSIDYSSAVEANFKNNGPHERLNLFQASIYGMPFEPESFDKVFCFGVLQHTPDFKQSIRQLCRMVKPGGELVIDFYPIRGWYTKIHAKYLFRPLTKQLKHAALLSLIEKNADGLIAAYKFLHRVKLGVLSRFIPICDIKNTLPEGLSAVELKEWVILDTFDMFSPAYDHPQRIKKVAKWINEEGLRVSFADFVEFGGNNKAAVVRALKLIK